jgi:putative hemolysin
MDDPGPANFIPQLILVAVLTLVNAFFAATEMAVVSVNKVKIKNLAEEGNKRARTLEKLISEQTAFLSTIQVAITLAGFFSSASAATGMSDELGRFLEGYGIPWGTEIAIVIITLILSYFTLVLGELVPKRIALQKSEAVALFAAKPVAFCKVIAKPFVKLLSVSTNLVLRLFGMKGENLDEKVSEEEIRSLVEEGEETGGIREAERDMIDGVFEFNDIIAEEVMTPRTDVYMINIEKPLAEYVDEMINERYSRIPVYEEDVDNIIGILYIKDFMREAYKVGFDKVDVRKILRPAYFVPERKSINELFEELQKSKRHMAILIDEYGGFSGIVTIEDLVEEVMGNIEDEFDIDDPDIRKVDASTFVVKGTVTIEELNDELETDLDEDSEDYDTIGGLVINLLGHIPPDGYTGTAEYENLTIKVESVHDKRVERVKIYVHPPAAEEQEEEEDEKDKKKNRYSDD